MARLELAPALGAAPLPGTSDEQTARWLSRSQAQLLVVPFHFHRGSEQSRLDGIGALLALPSSIDFRDRVLFMPVRGFSWTTSFQPRYDILRSERPRLAEHLIVAQEEELESPALHLRVRRMLEYADGRHSRPPTHLPRARAPELGDALHRLGERFSLPPMSVPRRASGAWKFNPPEEETVAEEQFGSTPPISGTRVIVDEPVGVRPIYEDFIDRNKSSG